MLHTGVVAQAMGHAGRSECYVIIVRVARFGLVSSLNESDEVLAPH